MTFALPPPALMGITSPSPALSLPVDPSHPVPHRSAFVLAPRAQSLSLSRVTKLALLRRASLLFLFFPFVFTLTFRASDPRTGPLSSPAFRWRRPRSADSFDLDDGGAAGAFDEVDVASLCQLACR